MYLFNFRIFPVTTFDSKLVAVVLNWPLLQLQNLTYKLTCRWRLSNSPFFLGLHNLVSWDYKQPDYASVTVSQDNVLTSGKMNLTILQSQPTHQWNQYPTLQSCTPFYMALGSRPLHPALGGSHPHYYHFCSILAQQCLRSSHCSSCIITWWWKSAWNPGVFIQRTQRHGGGCTQPSIRCYRNGDLFRL